MLYEYNVMMTLLVTMTTEEFRQPLASITVKGSRRIPCQRLPLSHWYPTGVVPGTTWRQVYQQHKLQ